MLLARPQSLTNGIRMERNYGEEVRKITEVPILATHHNTFISVIKFCTAASHIEQLSPGKLEIQKVQPADGGMYRCVAKNKYGSETRYFQLNITMGKLQPFRI